MDKIYFSPGIGFVSTWFVTSVLTIIFAALFSVYLNTDKVVSFKNNKFSLYAALPDENLKVEEQIDKKDARAKIISNFLALHKSPMSSLGGYFVKVSDTYGLDWRLLPAISMQESNGGKKVIKNSYNPFGFGIYGDLITRFASWEQSIERVGRALRTDYLDKGLGTPEEIMTKYNPPSMEKNGEWAKGVLSFMEVLR